ncbi:putative chromatin regulator PHD family [Helianthus debilis subsp. tardiflorus]
MGLEDADRLDEGTKAGFLISCSICLEDVTDCGDRAFAKLHCGHQFHLDCIGSAFNVKGIMQCPNCRKIEKGQWLYADGSRSYAEINIDDLVNPEDVYDLTYHESSMWCPYSEFSRLAAAVAIDEVEFPTAGYNEIVGQHAVFGDQSATVSSATRICPFIAYVHPSTPSANVGDGGRYNNNNRWNNSQSEIPNSYSFPTMDAHYNAHVDHPRMPTRTNIDMPTSGSYVHPFLSGQSSSTRGPGSISSVMNPHPDSGARAWERSQALEAYYQQPSTRMARRPNTQVQVGSSSDQTHGVYYPPSSRSFHDVDNSMVNPFHHALEREPPHPHPYPYPHETVPFHQPGGGSARQRHGSARVHPSHGQYWS